MVSEAVSVCSLPQEMLLKIFTLLSRSDLYNVLLVCRKWRTVAETPWLWRRMEVEPVFAHRAEMTLGLFSYSPASKVRS